MAKKNQPTATAPTVNNFHGLKLLKTQLTRGEALLVSPSWSNHDYGGWEASTEQTLKDVFGSDHGNVSNFQTQTIHRLYSVSADSWMGGRYEDPGPTPTDDNKQEIVGKIAALKASIQFLEDRIDIVGEGNRPADRDLVSNENKNIFIVHGHDEQLKEATAKLLQKLELNPIILHLQANEGKTLIEKFETHGNNSSFAVVLLTGDDFGRSVKEASDKDRLRARQNVVLELGYFMGRLGRSRVCAIYEENVDIPSDFLGVTYVKYDEANRWKVDLARELRAAKYNVSLDKADSD